VLRKVKTDIEGLRNHEKVIGSSQQMLLNWLVLLQVVTDAKALMKQYKRLVRKWWGDEVRWCVSREIDSHGLMAGKMEKNEAAALTSFVLTLVALNVA
jgi:hypothetical protein